MHKKPRYICEEDVMIPPQNNAAMLECLIINAYITYKMAFLTLCATFRSSHRDSFQKYLFFFSRSNPFIIFQEGPFVPRTDMNFPGGSICSSNRHEFSRRVYMFFEQTRIFQEGLSKRPVFLRGFYLFVEQTLLSHRTDTYFPRNPYLFLEHIRIFQEPLFSHRTDTHFPGSPI